MSESTFTNIGANGVDNRNAPAPGLPASLPQAKGGTPAQDDGKNCGVHAGTGDKGITGNAGIKGQNGGVPGDGNQIKLTMAVMEGHYTLTVKGGDAGNGGPGGKGGTGQAGGPGGPASSHCGAGAQGPGGDGGVGGDGGDGPSGGNAGDIYITYASGSPTFSATLQGGRAGSGGTPGGGGEPGAGIPPGGSLGSGQQGKSGKPGDNGQMFVNGKPQTIPRGG